MRSGAIMVLFAAFLEFRTHEVQALRERDQFHVVWKCIGALTEGLAKTDEAAKYSVRSLSKVIEMAGMEPDVGRAENIKSIVIPEKIKALQNLPIVPESFYTYSKNMAIAGKVMVVVGTLIWAFGDLPMQWLRSA